MKTLKFKTDDVTARYYEMLYEGLATCGTKGAETRTLGKVFIKLEEIGKQGEKTLLYTLKNSADISLEDAEHELIKRLLDTVEWSGIGSRTAGPMLEWIETAQPLKIMK